MFLLLQLEQGLFLLLMIENNMVLQLLAYTDSKEEIDVKVSLAKSKAANTALLYRNNAPMKKIKGEADGSYTVFNIRGFSRHAALIFK